jgi:hypothetical protein
MGMERPGPVGGETAADRGPRRRRRLVPLLEGLDARTLPSAGLSAHQPTPQQLTPHQLNSHHLGAYLTPSPAVLHATSAVTFVDVHDATNTLLSGLLGPGLDVVEQRVVQQGTPPNAVLDLVLAQPLVQALLSRQDTYTLFSSPALTALVGSQMVGTSGQTTQTVTLVLPASSLIQVNPGVSVVEVPPMAGTPGFLVSVPTNQILTLPNGFISVTFPLSSVPAGVTLPTNNLVPTGALADVYAATGPVLAQESRSGAGQVAPNGPRTVPGLRLPSALASGHYLGMNGQGVWLRILHLAADRDVFTLNAGQEQVVDQGVAQFEQTVQALLQEGVFQPPVPPPAPPLPTGPLNGTLEVSAGAFRKLASVNQLISGLQLPGVGNFPGRLDVGYVFARNGDFGVALTARGPLSGNPPGLASHDLVGGDIRVQVSNAPSLTALDGTRAVEGLTLGALRSSELESSRSASGVSTFAGSSGYGTGLEYGTGTSYTLVIPLGNVYSLIPQAPPT